MKPAQPSLFGEGPDLPDGMSYAEEIITPAEENRLTLAAPARLFSHHHRQQAGLAMAATLLPLIGTAVSAAGTIAGGAAANSAAQAQAQMNQFKARQAEIAAGEARAAGQREAIEKRREGSLAQSTLQVQAAARPIPLSSSWASASPAAANGAR